MSKSMMPSNRRLKVAVMALTLILLSLLWVSSSAQSSNDEFYERTVAGLDARAAAAKRPQVPTENVERPVRESQEDNLGRAKTVQDHIRGAGAIGNHGRVGKAEQKEWDEEARVPGHLADENEPATGKKEDKTDKQMERKPPQVVMGDRGGGRGERWDMGDKKDEAADSKTEEDRIVDGTLNEILKKSPIIIFSKSYCLYSKKAKHIFSLYTISPAPYIVELDEHDLGPKLQAKLEKTTGRRTVPNIIINGASIGGGDDVSKLHDEGVLIATIKEYGGKRIIEATLKD